MISSAVCCNKHPRLCAVLLSLKNLLVFIYTRLHSKSCYYLYLYLYLSKSTNFISVKFFSLCIIIVIIIPVLFVIVNVIVVLTLFDTIIVIVVVVVVFFVIVIIISVTPLILLSFFLFLFWYCQGFRITALKMRNLFLCRAQFLGCASLSTPPGQRLRCDPKDYGDAYVAN